jgi:two-component system, NarL family, response regulator LiaR
MIRVLIVDDQAVIREGLKVILNASGRIEVAGVASGAEEALALAARVRPEVVLMDLKMPVVNGIQATRLFRAQFPDTAVLVLTTYDEDDWVIDAVRAGASGYMLKDSDRDALIAAIEGTAAGRSHLDPNIAGKVMNAVRFGAPARPDFAAELSERELEVLRLLASGLSNAAIGDRLALAEGTVRNYVTTIFAKLDVTDRAQATALAWRHGLVRGE